MTMHGQHMLADAIASLLVHCNRQDWDAVAVIASGAVTQVLVLMCFSSNMHSGKPAQERADRIMHKGYDLLCGGTHTTK